MAAATLSRVGRCRGALLVAGFIVDKLGVAELAAHGLYFAKTHRH